MLPNVGNRAAAPTTPVAPSPADEREYFFSTSRFVRLRVRGLQESSGKTSKGPIEDQASVREHEDHETSVPGWSKR